MQELILDLSSARTDQLPSAPAAVIRPAPVDHGGRGAYGDATVEAFIADLKGLHSKVSRRLAMVRVDFLSPEWFLLLARSRECLLKFRGRRGSGIAFVYRRGWVPSLRMSMYPRYANSRWRCLPVISCRMPSRLRCSIAAATVGKVDSIFSAVAAMERIGCVFAY